MVTVGILKIDQRVCLPSGRSKTVSKNKIVYDFPYLKMTIASRSSVLLAQFRWYFKLESASGYFRTRPESVHGSGSFVVPYLC